MALYRNCIKVMTDKERRMKTRVFALLLMPCILLISGGFYLLAYAQTTLVNAHLPDLKGQATTITSDSVADTSILMSQTVGLLIYPDAENINRGNLDISSTNVSGNSLSYDTEATLELLYAYISRKLQENGWSLMSDSNYGLSKQLTFQHFGNHNGIPQQLFLSIAIMEIDPSDEWPNAYRHVIVGLRSIPDQRKIPLLPNAGQVKIEETERKDEKSLYSATFSTAQSPQDIHVFYQMALESRGWRIDDKQEKENLGEVSYYFYELGPQRVILSANLTLSISGETGGPNIVTIKAIGDNLEFQVMKK